MRFPLLAILFGLLVLLNAHAAFAGPYDHGGGGTFIVTDQNPQPFLWDLYLANPSHNKDLVQGDVIEISPTAEQDGGEWLDPAKVRRAADFLNARFELWKSQLPIIVGELKNDEEHDWNIIATKFKIAAVSELSMSSASHPDWTNPGNLLALPGAFTDYSTGVVFLDIGLWNRAGLKSQAALLLHERLRRLQRRYELSNANLQRIVATVILEEPVSQPNEDGFFGKDWLGLKRENFPEPALQPVDTIAQEVAEAKRKGYIGTRQVSGPVRASGSKNRIPGENGDIEIEPLSCDDTLPVLLPPFLHNSLQCLNGDVVGSGLMSFGNSFQKSVKIEAAAAFSSDGAKIAFDLFKDKLIHNWHSPSELVTFTRQGENSIRVSVGTVNPVVKVIQVDHPEKLHTFGVHASRTRKTIEAIVITADNGKTTKDVVIAEAPLPPIHTSPLDFKPDSMLWTYTMSDGCATHFIRVKGDPSDGSSL